MLKQNKFQNKKSSLKESTARLMENEMIMPIIINGLILQALQAPGLAMRNKFRT